MSWFADFKEFSVFTVLCLAVALVGGVLALVKRDKMKPIMIVTGVLEVAAIAAALIWFAVTKDVSDSAFGSVEMSKGVFSILVVALVVVMILLMVLSGRKEKWTARDLANAAICVAMSFILSCIKLYEMPQGGSITPASLLPLVLYMVAFGPGRGLVVGFAYGLLQLLQGAYVIHPAQLLVDYPMAFGALALGGFARYLPLNKKLQLPVAVVFAYVGRYLMAVLSGVAFFGEYAPEGQSALAYSLVYNITYLGPDCAVCALISLIPGFDRLTESLRKRT